MKAAVMKEFILLVCVISLFSGLIIMATDHPSSTQKPDPAVVEQMVCDMSINAVTKNLKAPATAKFPSCVDLKMYKNPRTGEWDIGGFVDAQNGFGAMLRRQWIVVIKTDKGLYQVSEVHFVSGLKL